MQDLVATKDEAIQTHDLYYASYLMANGAKLEKALVTPGKGKRRIMFEFSGKNIIKLAYEYISGEGVVNVRFLKSAMAHLRGIVFEKVNE